MTEERLALGDSLSCIAGKAHASNFDDQSSSIDQKATSSGSQVEPQGIVASLEVRKKIRLSNALTRRLIVDFNSIIGLNPKRFWRRSEESKRLS